MEDHARDPLAERLRLAELAALDLYAVYLGERLGLYRELAAGGSATFPELAARAGIAERYAREWLEQQAVTGFLEVEDAGAPAVERRYLLPEAHVAALVDRDGIEFSTHRAVDVVRGGRRLPDLVEAFRTGGGIPPLPWEPEG
ncbi:MAG TPA: SAM-dependent methyltransferase, partial [Actinomycetota bacterium]|nr:SAM-dependent methyltransferase [Actinomycetota bacterium]